MSLYAKNISLLRKREPQLADLLDETVIDKEIYEVFPARNGQPSLRVNQEGQQILFHSGYDPAKEAARLAETVDLENKNLVIANGLGLGYHVLALFARLSPQQILVVAESDPVILKASLEVMDLSDLLQSRRTIFVAGATANLNKKIAAVLNINSLEGLTFMDHRPSMTLCKEFYNEVLDKVRSTINQLILNQMTIINEAEKWFNNTLTNLPQVINNPSVAGLFGAFAGQPVIIVSAGPSLDKNVEYLRLAKGRALIVCVGTALKALLKRGIIPDMVVSVDPREENYQHFVGLDLDDIYLVAEPTSHPGVFETYTGPKLICSYGGSIINWIEKNVRPIGRIKSGGSVATVALDLAVKFGGNPIVFLGQDLAFTQGRTHAGGTIYEEVRQEENEDSLNLVKVPGYFGGQVLSSRILSAFRSWIENYIAESPNTLFINATEGGALIKGAQRMLFKEVIFRYCHKELNVALRLQEYYEKSRQATDPKKIEKKLRKLEIDLKELHHQSHSTLKLVIRLAEEFGSVGETRKVREGLERLARADARVDRSEAFLFIHDVIKPAFQRIKTFEKVARGVKLKLISAKEIYFALTKNAAHSASLLQKVLEELKSQEKTN